MRSDSDAPEASVYYLGSYMLRTLSRILASEDVATDVWTIGLIIFLATDAERSCAAFNYLLLNGEAEAFDCIRDFAYFLARSRNRLGFGNDFRRIRGVWKD